MITQQKNGPYGGSRLEREANEIFHDLTQKIKTQKAKLENMPLSPEEKELQECTFKP